MIVRLGLPQQAVRLGPLGSLLHHTLDLQGSHSARVGVAPEFIAAQDPVQRQTDDGEHHQRQGPGDGTLGRSGAHDCVDSGQDAEDFRGRHGEA
jgi:hypothetical protein